MIVVVKHQHSKAHLPFDVDINSPARLSLTLQELSPIMHADVLKVPC